MPAVEAIAEALKVLGLGLAGLAIATAAAGLVIRLVLIVAGRAYDDASRLTSVTGPNGLVSTYAYDGVDRLTALNYTQNTSPLLSLGYTYDAAGNVATYADDAGTTSFGYDALNRLISADHPGTDDFTYEYDPAGNITELVGPSGTSTREYSDGDRLLSEASTASHSELIATDIATGDWTDSGNLAASDDSHATATPDAATTPSLEAEFDFGAIPAGAVIDEVNVEVEWHSSLATAELTLGAQALLDGIPVGTETTEATNPSTDTIASFAVADVDRAELETLTVAVRATRVGGDPVTASLDVVSVQVIYTLPLREFTYDANGSLLDDGAGTTYAYDALARLTTVFGAGRRIQRGGISRMHVSTVTVNRVSVWARLRWAGRFGILATALLLVSCDNIGSFDRLGVSLGPDGTTIQIHYVACEFERVVAVRLEEITESGPAENPILWSVTSDTDTDQTTFAVGETPEGFEEGVSFGGVTAAEGTLLAAVDTEPGVGAAFEFALEDLRMDAVYGQDSNEFLDPAAFQEQALETCREE